MQHEIYVCQSTQGAQTSVAVAVRASMMPQQVGDAAYVFQVLVAPIAPNSSALMTAPATVAAGQ